MVYSVMQNPCYHKQGCHHMQAVVNKAAADETAALRAEVAALKAQLEEVQSGSSTSAASLRQEAVVTQPADAATQVRLYPTQVMCGWRMSQRTASFT